MKVIIAGSRSFNDYPLLKTTCEKIFSQLQWEHELSSKDFEIVSGKAGGADSLGERFAKEYGIQIKEFPAKWDDLKAKDAFIKTNSFGKPYNAKAGHARNTSMLEYVSDDGCAIYFWDGESPGTKDCITKAKKMGIRYFWVKI